MSDPPALGIVCPYCSAHEGERCAGTDDLHTARVAAWQASKRAEHLKAPPEERERVRRYLADLRASRGWMTRGTERG